MVLPPKFFKIHVVVAYDPFEFNLFTKESSKVFKDTTNSERMFSLLISFKINKFFVLRIYLFVP